MPSRPVIALAVATAGYMLVLLDVTIVNVALPAIADGLHASRTQLQWVVDAYALALAGLMLPAGALADGQGRRRVFALGVAVFGVASAACALAPTAGALIAARAAQGAGAAAMLPASLALVTAAHRGAGERAGAIGIWAGLGSLGVVLGPLLGGVLTGSLGWRAVFWVPVPVCSAALLGLHAVAESRAAGGAGPVLDLGLFRRPGFGAANAGAGLMNLGVLGCLFALSLMLQAGQRLSPAAAGVRLVPLVLPMAVLPALAARAIRRIGPRLPAALGLAGTAMGFLALALLGEHASYAAMFGPLLLAGVALAFATPGVVTAATSSVPDDRAGMAAAVNNTARQAGGAVGVAVIGGVGGAGAFALGAAALAAGAIVCGTLLSQ